MSLGIDSKIYPLVFCCTIGAAPGSGQIKFPVMGKKTLEKIEKTACV